MEYYFNGEKIGKSELDRAEIGEETAQEFKNAENFEQLKTALLRILDLDGGGN